MNECHLWFVLLCSSVKTTTLPAAAAQAEVAAAQNVNMFSLGILSYKNGNACL